jgi:hypothetical protein
MKLPSGQPRKVTERSSELIFTLLIHPFKKKIKTPLFSGSPIPQQRKILTRPAWLMCPDFTCISIAREILGQFLFLPTSVAESTMSVIK